MTAVLQSPLFSNDFPLNTTPLVSRRAREEIADETIGEAVGETAAKTYARITAGTSNERGIRGIETITDINRVTAAADVTALKAKVIKSKPSFGFVRDLSGNGGPAFTRA